MQIMVSICTRFDFDHTFEAVYGPLEVDGKVASEIPTGSDKLVERGIPKGMEAPEKVINYILGQAIINKVDRIHFEPAENGVLIRFRSCSTLSKKLEVPIKVHHEVIAKLKTLSQIGQGNISSPVMSVGHFRVTVSGRLVNIQSIFYPTINGEMAILKLSDFGNISTLIGRQSKEILDRIATFLKANHGVLYVTGPRESGRTTSEYFLLSTYDVERKKIVTVEDPVQCTLPRITQIQIGQNGVGTIRDGFDLALLLDPDVIYLDHLGEQKHLIEEIGFAALGGKTILTSFMAFDCSSSVVRLLELARDPVVIAKSLAGFLSQRLIRTLCPKCKAPAELPDDLLQRMPENETSPQVFAAVGCDGCQMTGYVARTLLAEFMPTSPGFCQMIIDRQGYQDFHQFARKQNIPTLEEQALILVARGETSADEFYRLF
jgi:type II secretory ATPase GspE/PulE/Tfp pilus assembly ATPase PilB-like protein